MGFGHELLYRLGHAIKREFRVEKIEDGSFDTNTLKWPVMWNKCFD
jgi:hypothetical protein